MIPKPSKEKFTFIFHRENTAPKYFEISRQKLIIYLATIPTGVVILLFTFLALSIFSKPSSEEPSSSQSGTSLESKISSNDQTNLGKEKEELQKDFEELQKTNQDLVNKLSTNSGKFAPPLQDLSLFTILPDQKDLSATPIMSINEVKITEEGQELHFHGNLLNSNPESTKISGHLFIFMRSANSLWVYPNEAFLQDKLSLNFNSGETVLFARLRPIDANFPKPPKGSKVLFKVLLFSRTGDLLHKEIFPYDAK